MPDNYRTPGVYIQEQSYPDPLEGAETTITTFPGRFTKGPDHPGSVRFKVSYRIKKSLSKRNT